MAFLLAVVYFFSNVAAAHAAEANLWAERRNAARRMDAASDRQSSASSANDQLLAQLPKTDTMIVEGLARPGLPGPFVVNSPNGPEEKKNASLPWLSAVLPYAVVSRVHLGKGPGASIVLVQDIHGVGEAQKNISGILDGLGRTAAPNGKGPLLVGMEGAAGPFVTGELRASQDPQAVKDVADFMLGKGFIVGAEHAALSMPVMPELWGVEDLGAYHANIRAYLDSLTVKDSLKSLFSDLRARTAAAKEKVYSPELKEFDKHAAAYAARSETLGTFVRYLWRGEGAVGEKKFRNVVLFLSALDQEGRLDFKQVEKDRASLVEVLARTLTSPQLDALIQASMAYRLGQVGYGAYNGYLKKLCRDAGVRLDRFPQMRDYVEYVMTADRIDRNDLLDELSALQIAAQDCLAKAPEQKALINMSRRLALLDKLTSQQMTPQDWAEYEKDRDNILGISSEFSALLKPSEEFCRIALSRNRAMVENLLAKIGGDGGKTSEPAADATRPRAVLVCGGFHTDGLARLLDKRGLSYVVLTPKLTEVPKDSHYLDVFAHDTLPLEKLFQGEKISLAPAPTLAESTISSPVSPGSAEVAAETRNLAEALLAARRDGAGASGSVSAKRSPDGRGVRVGPSSIVIRRIKPSLWGRLWAWLFHHKASRSPFPFEGEVLPATKVVRLVDFPLPKVDSSIGGMEKFAARGGKVVESGEVRDTDGSEILVVARTPQALLGAFDRLAKAGVPSAWKAKGLLITSEPWTPPSTLANPVTVISEKAGGLAGYLSRTAALPSSPLNSDDKTLTKLHPLVGVLLRNFRPEDDRRAIISSAWERLVQEVTKKPADELETFFQFDEVLRIQMETSPLGSLERALATEIRWSMPGEFWSASDPKTGELQGPMNMWERRRPPYKICRTAAVLPVTPDGNVYCIQRAFHQYAYPGVLDLVGERGRYPESFMDNALRLIEEEIHLIPDRARLRPVRFDHGDGFNEEVLRTRLVEGGRQINDDEGIFVYQLTAEEVEKLNQRNRELESFWRDFFAKVAQAEGISPGEVPGRAAKDVAFRARMRVLLGTLPEVKQNGADYFEIHQGIFLTLASLKIRYDAAPQGFAYGVPAILDPKRNADSARLFPALRKAVDRIRGVGVEVPSKNKPASLPFLIAEAVVASPSKARGWGIFGLVLELSFFAGLGLAHALGWNVPWIGRSLGVVLKIAAPVWLAFHVGFLATLYHAPPEGSLLTRKDVRNSLIAYFIIFGLYLASYLLIAVSPSGAVSLLIATAAVHVLYDVRLMFRESWTRWSSRWEALKPRISAFVLHPSTRRLGWFVARSYAFFAFGIMLPILRPDLLGPIGFLALGGAGLVVITAFGRLLGGLRRGSKTFPAYVSAVFAVGAILVVHGLLFKELPHGSDVWIYVFSMVIGLVGALLYEAKFSLIGFLRLVRHPLNHLAKIRSAWWWMLAAPAGTYYTQILFLKEFISHHFTKTFESISTQQMFDLGSVGPWINSVTCLCLVALISNQIRLRDLPKAVFKSVKSVMWFNTLWWSIFATAGWVLNAWMQSENGMVMRIYVPLISIVHSAVMYGFVKDRPGADTSGPESNFTLAGAWRAMARRPALFLAGLALLSVSPLLMVHTHAGLAMALFWLATAVVAFINEVVKNPPLRTKIGFPGALLYRMVAGRWAQVQVEKESPGTDEPQIGVSSRSRVWVQKHITAIEDAALAGAALAGIQFHMVSPILFVGLTLLALHLPGLISDWRRMQGRDKGVLLIKFVLGWLVLQGGMTLIGFCLGSAFHPGGDPAARAALFVTGAAMLLIGAWLHSRYDKEALPDLLRGLPRPVFMSSRPARGRVSVPRDLQDLAEKETYRLMHTDPFGIIVHAMERKMGDKSLFEKSRWNRQIEGLIAFVIASFPKRTSEGESLWPEGPYGPSEDISTPQLRAQSVGNWIQRAVIKKWGKSTDEQARLLEKRDEDLGIIEIRGGQGVGASVGSVDEPAIEGSGLKEGFIIYLREVATRAKASATQNNPVQSIGTTSGGMDNHRPGSWFEHLADALGMNKQGSLYQFLTVGLAPVTETLALRGLLHDPTGYLTFVLLAVPFVLSLFVLAASLITKKNRGAALRQAGIHLGFFVAGAGLAWVKALLGVTNPFLNTAFTGVIFALIHPDAWVELFVGRGKTFLELMGQRFLGGVVFSGLIEAGAWSGSNWVQGAALVASASLHGWINEMIVNKKGPFRAGGRLEGWRVYSTAAVLPGPDIMEEMLRQGTIPPSQYARDRLNALQSRDPDLYENVIRVLGALLMGNAGGHTMMERNVFPELSQVTVQSVFRELNRHRPTVQACWDMYQRWSPSDHETYDPAFQEVAPLFFDLAGAPDHSRPKTLAPDHVTFAEKNVESPFHAGYNNDVVAKGQWFNGRIVFLSVFDGAGRPNISDPIRSAMRTMAEEVESFITRKWRDEDHFVHFISGLPRDRADQYFKGLLRMAMLKVHDGLVEHNQKQGLKADQAEAATSAVLAFRGPDGSLTVVSAQAGDSSAYAIVNGEIKPLVTRNLVEGEKPDKKKTVDAFLDGLSSYQDVVGPRDRSLVRAFEDRNEVGNLLGVVRVLCRPAMNVEHFPPKDRVRLLVASDGVTDVLTRDELGRACSAGGDPSSTLAAIFEQIDWRNLDAAALWKAPPREIFRPLVQWLIQLGQINPLLGLHVSLSQAVGRMKTLKFFRVLLLTEGFVLPLLDFFADPNKGTGGALLDAAKAAERMDLKFRTEAELVESLTRFVPYYIEQFSADQRFRALSGVTARKVREGLDLYRRRPGTIRSKGDDRAAVLADIPPAPPRPVAFATDGSSVAAAGLIRRLINRLSGREIIGQSSVGPLAVRGVAWWWEPLKYLGVPLALKTVLVLLLHAGVALPAAGFLTGTGLWLVVGAMGVAAFAWEHRKGLWVPGPDGTPVFRDYADRREQLYALLIYAGVGLCLHGPFYLALAWWPGITPPFGFLAGWALAAHLAISLSGIELPFGPERAFATGGQPPSLPPVVAATLETDRQKFNRFEKEGRLDDLVAIPISHLTLFQQARRSRLLARQRGDEPLRGAAGLDGWMDSRKERLAELMGQGVVLTKDWKTFWVCRLGPHTMKLTASLDVYVLHSPTSALEIGDEVIKEWKEEDARLSAGGRGSAKKSIRLAKGSSAEVPPQSFVLVQAEGRPAVVATYEGAGGYWRAAVIDLAEQKVVTGPVDLSGEKPLLTLGSPGATVSLALLPDGALRVADLHSDGTTTVTASGAVSVAVPAGPESLLASAEQVERNVKRLRLGRRPWFVFQSSIVIRFVLGMLKHGLFPGPHETLERYRMRVARLGGTQDEQWNHCLFILQQMVADEEVKSVADAEASLAHWVDRALEETQDLLAHRREAETPTPTPTATPTPIPESVGFTLLESRSAGLADMKRGDELEPHLGPRFVGALTKTSDDDATFEPMRRYLESLQGRSRDESAAEQEDEALGAGRPEWTMESINSYYELLASPDRRRALAAHLLAIGQDTAMRDEFLAGLVLLHQAGGSLSGANLDESSPEPAHRAAREQDARLAVEWLAFSGAARGMSIADARSELNAILARQADRVLRRTEALARWQAQGARDVKAREAELMRYPIVVDFNGFESWSPEEFAQRAAWLAGAFAASLTSRNAAGVLVTTPRKPQELRDALIRAHPDFQNAWGLRILGAEECKGLYVENKRLSLPALRESFGYRNFSLVVTADESLLDKGEFRDVTVWTFARIDAVVRAALERLRFILIQA